MAEVSAESKITAANEAREKAALQAQAQESELSSLQKRLKESEQANARLSSEFAGQKEKLDGKIQNQRQVLLPVKSKEDRCSVLLASQIL